ncbi:unnamed protein product [Auanema sp. JU1783]|nr:unnamed protein product [Auanema sp. JU1783]
MSSTALKTSPPAKRDMSVEKMYHMRTVVSIGALLPGLGCYFCIAYTYVFQFETITNFTQQDSCPDVHSPIPPVSYSIGVWKPQRFYWMTVMFIHMPLRIFFIILYKRMFTDSAPKSLAYHYARWCYMRTLCIEAMGLSLVSIININDNFALHALGFGTWISAFNVNMLFNIILHHFGKVRQQSRAHEITWRLKVFMFCTGAIASCSTAFTYPLFLKLCSRFAYISFSMVELMIIGYNSIFYSLAYWDFPNTRVTLGIHTGPHPKKIGTVSENVEKLPI